MLQKIHAAQEDSNVIGDFLEWLGEHGFFVCESTGSANHPWVPTTQSTEQLLAGYFEIDLDMAERERREIIQRERRKLTPIQNRQTFGTARKEISHDSKS
jgi:hypothetical protein